MLCSLKVQRFATFNIVAFQRRTAQMSVSGENSFRHAQRGRFFQATPTLSNPFLSDVTLQRYLRRTVPAEVS